MDFDAFKLGAEFSELKARVAALEAKAPNEACNCDDDFDHIDPIGTVAEAVKLIGLAGGDMLGLRERVYSVRLKPGKKLRIKATFVGDYELACIAQGTDGSFRSRRNSFEGDGEIFIDKTTEERIFQITAWRKICNWRREIHRCAQRPWVHCVSALTESETQTPGSATVGWDDQRVPYAGANVRAVIEIL